MSVVAIALKHLIDAGVSGDDLVRAIAEIETALVEQLRITRDASPTITRDVTQRSSAAERQALYRKRLKDRRDGTGITRDVTQTITRDAERDAGDVTDVTDPLPLPKPPHTPQTPTPTGIDLFACAREADPITVLAGLRLAWAMANLAAIAEIRPKAGGFPCPPGVSIEQWKGFVQHRRQHKKGGPLNDRAYTLLCNKLAELSADGWPPGDMIDLAIERGWLTVFKPHDQRNNGYDPRNHSGRYDGGGFRDAVLGDLAFGRDP